MKKTIKNKEESIECSSDNVPTDDEIIEYNEIDCKAVFLLLQLVRSIIYRATN